MSRQDIGLDIGGKNVSIMKPLWKKKKKKHTLLGAFIATLVALFKEVHVLKDPLWAV